MKSSKKKFESYDLNKKYLNIIIPCRKLSTKYFLKQYMYIIVLVFLMVYWYVYFKISNWLHF